MRRTNLSFSLTQGSINHRNQPKCIKNLKEKITCGGVCENLSRKSVWCGHTLEGVSAVEVWSQASSAAAGEAPRRAAQLAWSAPEVATVCWARQSQARGLVTSSHERDKFHARTRARLQPAQ